MENNTTSTTANKVQKRKAGSAATVARFTGAVNAIAGTVLITEEEEKTLLELKTKVKEAYLEK